MAKRNVKKSGHGIVMVTAMSADRIEHRQNMLRSSAASPQASRRDLLARRGGKVAQSWKKETW